MLADLAAGLMAVGLAAYAVLGGADFGGGFWDLTAGGAGRGARVRGMIQRSLTPVWEANHVWLIFVLVVFWTAFPVAFGSAVSTLYVPLFAAAIGIIFRGTAFALRGEAATIAEARALGAAFALSSVLVPFFLGCVVGGIASGRVPVGNAAGDALTSWWNPTSIVVGVLAVATGAHLAAVFLGADSVRAGERDLVHAFRIRALVSGAGAAAIAVAGLIVVRSDARPLYDGLTSGGSLALVLLCFVASALTLLLELRGRFEPARLTAALAVGSIVGGWALAQHPYLLPGELTVDEAAARDAVLIAMLVSMAVGLLILALALGYLFRLVLSGRLDTEFRPLAAGDDRSAS